MGLLAYDKGAIQKRLEALSRNHCLAFATSCCERLIGNYIAFKTDVRWGDDVPLRRALDRLWTIVDGAVPSSQEISRLTAQCESVVPDGEDFEALLTTAAQDSAFAICSALDFVQSGAVTKAIQCSSYAIDTVDLYVQEIEHMDSAAADLESRMQGHRLMQREIRRQYDDLAELEHSTANLPGFQARARNEPKSNLDL